jgi:tRNA G18 (ribose-2'-O)-methylase SpoU
MDDVRRLKEEGYTVVSAEQTVDSVMLDTFVPDQGRKYAVVFGNEVSGVSQEVVDASDFALEIPQFGTKHSLNVSVSMGVILWHFKLHKH